MIYTDSPGYASEMLGCREFETAGFADEMLEAFFDCEEIHFNNDKTDFFYIAKEFSHDSQFDLLTGLSRMGLALPPRICCIAGSGKKFHGFHGRPWKALPGNLHVCFYLNINTHAAKIGAGLSMLPAVSIIEALDEIDSLRAKTAIKWVNDILVDNRKICGFIASGQSRGETFESAIIGIGLNVKAKPNIPSDGFVEGAASVCEFEETEQSSVLSQINVKIKQNLTILLEKGYAPLLEKYRERSMIIGREISLYSDLQGREPALIRRGKLSAIGENLELIFDDGKAYFSGRIREIS